MKQMMKIIIVSIKSKINLRYFLHCDTSCFSVHYPISKTERMTIEEFYKQLSSEPSREKPLVIYTFSSLRFEQNLILRMDIPDLQPTKNLQDAFFSVFDWSKNITGLFFYVKQQLDEYESMMKIIQGAITIIHRFLKSNLLEILCEIREDIFHYQTIYELDRIHTIIKKKSPNIPSKSFTFPHHLIHLFHRFNVSSIRNDFLQ